MQYYAMQIEDEAAEALAEKSLPADDDDIVSTIVNKGKQHTTRAGSYDSTMAMFELEQLECAVPVS